VGYIEEMNFLVNKGREVICIDDLLIKVGNLNKDTRESTLAGDAQ
jgi:hypothetical protein